MAYLMAQALQPGYEEDMFSGEAALAAAVGLNSADETLPYSTAELNAPEYSTDDFRMFSFKVARCSKRYVHDWRACPFAHPTENARRRDPRLHKYLPVPCPEYKRGICFRGDACPYSHGVYECWLHPAKYRTQLCKEGPHCRRPVCFFAHSVLDLRQPSHVWDGNSYEQPQKTAAAALLQAAAAAPACRTGSGSNASLLQQLAKQSSAEEAMNNSGGNGGGALASAGSEGSLSGSGRNGGGSSSAGPSSPHGSVEADGRNSSPPAMARDVQAAGAQANGAWTPASQNGLAMGERSGSGEASPSTPSRATSGDIPARPSAEASAAAALAAAPADLSALANLVALAQPAPAPAPAPRGGLPPRHSIDPAARMSFDVPAGGAPGQGPQNHRMSLDSLIQTRSTGPNGAPWAPALQDLQGGSSAPRMSNAVARKLGLAPQRTSNEARMAKLRSGVGLATPPRNSLDGLLQALNTHNGRASLEQQMVNQQMLAAAGLQAQMNSAAAVMGAGGYMAAPYPGAAGPGYHMAAPDPSMGGINPALLTVVAAQMGNTVPAPMPAPQAMPPQNAATMAALMDQLNGWNLNGGMQHVPQHGPAGYAGMGHMPGRASYDSGAGMQQPSAAAAAAFMAQQAQQPSTSAPFYLPSELESMMNNGELVQPIGAGQGRGRGE
ncbi:hypothetical protein N2152v2_007086 [Parachlorella kessleri]